MSIPVDSEEEQILQDLLRQKLNRSSEISPLPAGELLECFQTELAILKEELSHFKEGAPVETKRLIPGGGGGRGGGGPPFRGKP